MSASTIIVNYLGQGLAASMPVSPNVPTGGTAFYYQTDTTTLKVWNGSAWVSVTGGGGSSPLTTKGDIYGFDTVNDRIPVGTNGKVLTADSTQALGVGWSVVNDPISSVYPVFSVAGDSDEFDGASFTGWTAVNSGSHTPTITQTNNRASILHPGGDAAAELHAWMKSATVNVNDFIECAFSVLSSNQLCIGGLIMADGTTYGAGVNVCFDYSPFETNAIREFNGTGYNTFVGQSSAHILDVTRASDMFLRLKYKGSNNWEGYMSQDGISWILILSFSATLTPTKIGFFVSTWGNAGQAIWSFRYFKHGP